MHWQRYETEVYEHLSALFSGASITRNVQLPGSHSKRNRQIDVLIEDDVAGFPISIVVDAKDYARPLTVKHVDEFIGLLQDVNVQCGMLVTPIGYSKAARHRAHNSPGDIHLEVLSLAELRAWQAAGGIPYSGNNAICLLAPFGWILDIRGSHAYVAALHQRGRTLAEATQAGEWMYINFWHKDATASSVAELMAMHMAQKTRHYRAIETVERRGPVRKDGRRTAVLEARYDNMPFKEMIGYLDGDGVVVFFVLFTPLQLETTNLGKLMYVLKYSLHLSIEFRNEAKIEERLDSLALLEDSHKRAEGYTQVAMWYAEMRDHKAAARYHRISFETSPTVYVSVRHLMVDAFHRSRLDDALALSGALFRLAPENPRLLQDVLGACTDNTCTVALGQLFSDLFEEHSDNPEAVVNVGFHYGMLLVECGDRNTARKWLRRAGKAASSVSVDHQALSGIREMLSEIT